jgi:membrane protein implicated in regulation of membrane protease activity
MDAEAIAMWKRIPWRLVILIVALLLVACFAAGQAVTFAWLSSFPERASQLESLRAKFWSYTVVSAVLLLISLALGVRLFNRIQEIRKDKKEPAADHG